MKNLTQLVVVVAVLAVLAAVGGVAGAAAGEEAATTVSTFKVEGMTCGGCEAGVKAKVKKLTGVESVEASYKQGTARVVYDPAKVTPQQIIAAIEQLGYEAELEATGAQARAGARTGLPAWHRTSQAAGSRSTSRPASSRTTARSASVSTSSMPRCKRALRYPSSSTPAPCST